MTNATNSTPGSLRAFLEAGGDPMTLDSVHLLVEDAVQALGSAPGFRANRARTQRYYAQIIRSGGRLGLPLADGTLAPIQADAQSCDWEAELWEDLALARRLIDSLPEAEKADAHKTLDWERRPHPLDVEIPGADYQEGGQWSCANCGEAHDIGDGVRAVVVGFREDWSELEYRIPYCAGCIAVAAQAASPAPATV